MIKLMAATLFSLFSTFVSAQTLVLLVDVSDSTYGENADFQMESYASLLSNVQIQNMLSRNTVVVVLFGRGQLVVSNGSSQDAANAFRTLSTEEGRDMFPLDTSGTCLAQALNFLNSLSDSLSYPVIVDVSGDGKDNCLSIEDARERPGDVFVRRTREASQALYNKGIVINGLPIGAIDSPLVQFYDENVVTGFMEVAETLQDFETALYSKLYTEVSQLNNYTTESQSVRF